MADDIAFTDSVTIEIDDELPAAGATEVTDQQTANTATPSTQTEKQEEPPPSDKPEEGIEDLRRQLAERDARDRAQQDEVARLRAAHEEEARRRAEAERAAIANRQLAEQAQQKEIVSNYDAIVNALEAETRALEQQQSLLAKAAEDGDYPTVAKLQVQIGKTAYRIGKLEDGKTAIEDSRKQAALEPPPASQPPPQPDMSKPWTPQEYDQVIRIYSAQTAAWLRAHPQFATDPIFRNKIIKTHDYVVSVLGLQPDTTEYFNKVEELNGLRQAPPPPTSAAAATTTRSSDSTTGTAPLESTTTTTTTTAKKPAATAAAPAVRTVPSSRPNTNRAQITLTPEERRIARITLTPEIIGKNPDGSPRDPEKVFAQHKLERLRAEGQI